MGNSEIHNAFFGKNIFITGHTGFKGSWLAIWLQWLGSRVFGYSLAPPTKPSNFEVSRVRSLLTDNREGDVRDGRRLKAAIQTAQPDFIFHLAAQPIVRESFHSPRETWDINVIGTATLLDTIRSLGRPCVIVVVTSDKCYEHREQPGGYREVDAMGGFDPYSASKGACELLISSYRQSFFPPDKINKHGIKLASARAGNVIGGGDWGRDRIVTDIVLSLSKSMPIPIRNPGFVRPWQHVLEPLSGYLLLAARMAENNDGRWCSGWNFGPVPGEKVSVVNLVELFCREWGDDCRWEYRSNPDAPYEAGVLQLNIEKANLELNWWPRWQLKQAVQRTVRWYRSFYRVPGQQMYNSCLEDIEFFNAS